MIKYSDEKGSVKKKIKKKPEHMNVHTHIHIREAATPICLQAFFFFF